MSNLDSELIRSYEAGKAFPKPEGLLSLATVFSVSIEWLLTGEGESLVSIKDSEDQNPIEKAIAETKLAIQRNLATWGVKWKWLELFDNFLTNKQLISELKPSGEELIAIRYALSDGEINSEDHIVEYLKKVLRKKRKS
ncbi:helix-turn-helix domain-containing protein [Calditrichota bacterium]